MSTDEVLAVAENSQSIIEPSILGSFLMFNHHA